MTKNKIIENNSLQQRDDQIRTEKKLNENEPTKQ